jgi:hypothetical protein
VYLIWFSCFDLFNFLYYGLFYFIQHPIILALKPILAYQATHHLLHQIHFQTPPQPPHFLLYCQDNHSCRTYSPNPTIMPPSQQPKFGHHSNWPNPPQNSSILHHRTQPPSTRKLANTPYILIPSSSLLTVAQIDGDRQRERLKHKA